MKINKFKVQNIIATAEIGKSVSLIKVFYKCKNSEYNPEIFPGLILRIKEPKATILVFSNGKLVCTGTNSITKAKQVIEVAIQQINSRRKNNG